MKRLRKFSDVRVVEVCVDIIINILRRLPSKSLARFICVSKDWRKYIIEPYLIGFFCVEITRSQNHRFFFSSKESSLLNGRGLDESVNFTGERVNIVASSNGFLLCNKLRSRQRVYYVYNPATRQPLALPKTGILMKDPYVGFFCKIDDPDKDDICFTVVRYEVPPFRYYIKSITIESFSSTTNVWTVHELILDVPLSLCPSGDMTLASSVGVIHGVFCWLDNHGRLITLYDSVHKCFWTLELPHQMVVIPSNCCLGLSGGSLYLALLCARPAITVWKLMSNIRSRDAVWVVMHVACVATIVRKFPKAFGLAGSLRMHAYIMVFHPAVPHILYLRVQGKVISHDLKTGISELVYDFGEHWQKTRYYKFFSYEWHQQPRLL